MSKYNSEIEGIQALNKAYLEIRQEISKVIVGQDEVVKFVLVSIFSNGHCLLMGVPGLAKTLLVQTVSKVLDLSFNRIQFTPDLMPSDIVGSEILGEDRNFKFIKGPVFANIILADEINRTPPKTQAALLEAMQEKSVTAAGHTHILPKPFFVLATQNPIEQEGTYPLPEAQLDRFMFNVHLTYPSFSEELAIVKNTTGTQVQELNKIINANDINDFQQLVRNIPVADNVVEYAVKLVAKTRPQTEFAAEIVNKYISWGAGPRASQYLVVGAKCHAAIHGKFSPDIEDVQAVATTILRHRLVKNYKAEAEGISIEQIIKQLF
ncbi:AAA family ATPase [Pseudopedobacter sp.]|uniref:AAA family ATPase n=1 Tax=Pseudopedobacter sp. TaxID=1936787 RepID=UPI003341350D